MKRAFGIESDFLEDLNGKAHITRDTVMTYTIRGGDGQVAADSVFLEGAVNMTIDPDVSGGSCTDPKVHNSILGRDKVATDSMNFLRYGAAGVSERTAPARA